MNSLGLATRVCYSRKPDNVNVAAHAERQREREEKSESIACARPQVKCSRERSIYLVAADEDFPCRAEDFALAEREKGDSYAAAARRMKVEG